MTVDETWVHYYEPENKAQSSMGRAWVPDAKEFQDTTICWQGDGHSILGCQFFPQSFIYVSLNISPVYTGYACL